MTNLAYAHVILIFAQAKIEVLVSLRRFLDHYVAAISQVISLGDSIYEAIVFQIGTMPTTYFGVPIFKGHIKCELFFFSLRQWMSDRIHS